MEIKAEQKYLLLSPRKIRPVVEAIKKLSPTVAIERLPFITRRSSEFLIKVLKSAIANARVKGISESDLIIKEIQIGEGPRLKRGRPVSRGQFHPIKKRMSHIRIILTTKAEVKEVKAEAKVEPKVEEVKEKKVTVKKVAKKGTK